MTRNFKCYILGFLTDPVVKDTLTLQFIVKCPVILLLLSQHIEILKYQRLIHCWEYLNWFYFQSFVWGLSVKVLLWLWFTVSCQDKTFFFFFFQLVLFCMVIRFTNGKINYNKDSVELQPENLKVYCGRLSVS